MPRETIKARNARVGALLAEYDSTMAQLRKYQKMADELKEQVREIEPGPYGDWTLALGTPRNNLDQQEARRLLKDHGIAIPMKESEPPLVVRPRVQ